jgi:hypothetical protein
MGKLRTGYIWRLRTNIQFRISFLSCYPRSATIKIYETEILHVVLFRRETQRVRTHSGGVVNRVLRGIFGPITDEMIRRCRNLRKDLHNLCSSSNLIIMMKSGLRLTCHVARTVEKIMHTWFLYQKPKGDISLWRPRYRRRKYKNGS